MYFLRGAHTSYIKNGTYRCADSSHCPRISVLRALGYNQNISDTSNFTFALGLASETLFKKEFPEALTDVPVEMDLPFGAKFVGHADGIVDDTVWELKSISSVKVATEVVVKRKYKEGNLLQLLGYMIAAEKTRGVLRYVNFVWHSLTVAKVPVKLKPCNVDFITEICDDGSITVDGTKLDLSVEMILSALQGIASCLAEQRLPERPELWREKFDGPCSFCTLAPVCDLCDELPSFLLGVENTGHFERTEK